MIETRKRADLIQKFFRLENGKNKFRDEAKRMLDSFFNTDLFEFFSFYLEEEILRETDRVMGLMRKAGTTAHAEKEMIMSCGRISQLEDIINYWTGLKRDRENEKKNSKEESNGKKQK